MVRTEAPFTPIALGAKPFATVRPLFTVSVALAGAVLAPALVVVSAPAGIVFRCAPAVALVTLTVTVQEPPAGIVPPVIATLAPLLAAVTAPPQVVAPLAAALLPLPPAAVSCNAAP